MKFRQYCKDRIMLLILHAACMGGSFAYLYICGMKGNQLLLFYIAWLFILLCYLIRGWLGRRKYFNCMEENLKNLDKPYLLSEVMPGSHRLEDKLYRRFLRISNKSVIDAVHRLETQQQEYRDFIENWIHEVKLPITTMQLMCDNWKSRDRSLMSRKEDEGYQNEDSGEWENRREDIRENRREDIRKDMREDIRKFQAQLSQLENDVEKALYYARSDTVSQDYMIREISLKDTVLEAVRRNSPYLIRNKVQVEMCLEDERVYSDDKWLTFIVSQILLNAVKYRTEHCSIRIFSEKEEAGRSLVIEDNGIGIRKNELDRIFDKGFTGSNGRRTRQSTGIGLYLCRKLCDKLGMGITAQSQEGEYTRMSLTFPDGSGFFAR